MRIEAAAERKAGAIDAGRARRLRRLAVRHAAATAFAAAVGAASAITVMGAAGSDGLRGATSAGSGVTALDVQVLRDSARERYESVLRRLGIGEIERESLVEALMVQRDRMIAVLLGLPSDRPWTDADRRAVMRLAALAEENPEHRAQIEGVLSELRAFMPEDAAPRENVDAPWWLPVLDTPSASLAMGIERDLGLLLPGMARLRTASRDGAVAWQVLAGPYMTREAAVQAASVLEAGGLASSPIPPMQGDLEGA